jgi:hypothetical protein
LGIVKQEGKKGKASIAMDAISTEILGTYNHFLDMAALKPQ